MEAKVYSKSDFEMKRNYLKRLTSTQNARHIGQELAGLMVILF